MLVRIFCPAASTIVYEQKKIQRFLIVFYKELENSLINQNTEDEILSKQNTNLHKYIVLTRNRAELGNKNSIISVL